MASVPAEDLLPVLAPQPGTDLVPDGWCDAVVVPWLEEQTETYSLPKAAAQLDGMVSAYRTLKSDTFELVKARRFLEIRWGELLEPPQPGRRTDLEPEPLTHELEVLSPMDESRFRGQTLGELPDQGMGVGWVHPHTSGHSPERF